MRRISFIEWPGWLKCVDNMVVIEDGAAMFPAPICIQAICLVEIY